MYIRLNKECNNKSIQIIYNIYIFIFIPRLQECINKYALCKSAYISTLNTSVLIQVRFIQVCNNALLKEDSACQKNGVITMASLMYGIIEKLLHGRNPLNLKCSEARKLVADFYLELEAKTIQYTDKSKIDKLSTAVLKKYGLEYFAA